MDACMLELVYEHEDEEGFIWGDYYVCGNCHARLNGGILVAPDEELPPKYCGKCGAKFTYFMVRHDGEGGYE